MKLKSLLKHSTANRIQIVYENNDTYKEHLVDYSMHSSEIVDCFDGLTKYPNRALLPDFLLDMKVQYIDINTVTGSLYIRLK